MLMGAQYKGILMQPFLVSLLLAGCVAVQPKSPMKQPAGAVGKTASSSIVQPELFASVHEALSIIADHNSVLKWEASAYLTNHPKQAIPELERIIAEQKPGYFIAMCTLSKIGGDSVVNFYCDLLDKNGYELDKDGKKKIYGYGSPHGCCKHPHLFGENIVEQLGSLGDKAADPCLQRAWLDSDDAVRAAVPKARYDIGVLTRDDLLALAIADQKNRNLYFEALLYVAYEMIHKDIDSAIATFEMLCKQSEAGHEIQEGAHTGLVQCYEKKQQFDQALLNIDWVIQNSTDKEMVRRRKEGRPELLYLQGKLSVDEFFQLAKQENGLYDRIIVRLGRFQNIDILDRVIQEAPPDSRYVMDAHYCKYEYYTDHNQIEKADEQADFILKNCTYEPVRQWIRKSQEKTRLLAERNLKKH